MTDRYEQAMVEWLWDVDALRTVAPGGQEHRSSGGSYAGVLAALGTLGAQGFHVVGCSGAGNWLLWTLERRVG